MTGTPKAVLSFFTHAQGVVHRKIVGVNRVPLTTTLLLHPPIPTSSVQRLNDEQLKLLETKPLLEVALAEHERVKVAMEGVAKDLEREAAERAKLAPTSPPPRPVTALSINPAPEPHQPPAPASLSIPAGDPSDANTPESDAHQDAGSQPAAEGDASATPAEVVVTDSKGVSTDPVDTEEAGAQTDVTGPPPPPGLDPRIVSEAVAVAATLAAEEKDKAAREAEERGIEKGREDAAKGLSKVLRLLHVATRFEAKGERLPTAVDFFSKVGSLDVVDAGGMVSVVKRTEVLVLGESWLTGIMWALGLIPHLRRCRLALGRKPLPTRGRASHTHKHIPATALTRGRCSWARPSRPTRPTSTTASTKASSARPSTWTPPMAPRKSHRGCLTAR